MAGRSGRRRQEADVTEGAGATNVKRHIQRSRLKADTRALFLRNQNRECLQRKRKGPETARFSGAFEPCGRCVNYLASALD